jgi:RNA polymerase sigma factor (sigma-70 family)
MEDLHLSRIDTLWTLVSQAHRQGSTNHARAQEELLERYGGAIRRYLLASLRDSEAAEDLYQEFAIRFLRGSLSGADPSRGRFRDFVKGVLFHLVADHFKKKQRQPRQWHPEQADPATECPPWAEEEQTFLASWRDDLLARTWDALSVHEQKGQVYYTVLKFRADHPQMPSQEIAEKLGQQTGKSFTAVSVRKTLERARNKFAELLLDEIANALDRPTREAMEAELIDLGLFDHCQEALERWRDSS